MLKMRAQGLFFVDHKNQDKIMDAQLFENHGWKIAPEGTSAHKIFRFPSFNAAITWMASLAKQIDELDHHPEWKNVYNRVEVCLTTHDAGTLTELDIKLAKLLDHSYAVMQG